MIYALDGVPLELLAYGNLCKELCTDPTLTIIGVVIVPVLLDFY
jgi:hypothetical protein